MKKSQLITRQTTYQVILDVKGKAFYSYDIDQVSAALSCLVIEWWPFYFKMLAKPANTYEKYFYFKQIDSILSLQKFQCDSPCVAQAAIFQKSSR